MTRPQTPDEEFVELFEMYGAAETARRTGLGERAVFDRRRNIEARLGRTLLSPNQHSGMPQKTSYPGRVDFEVDNGVVLIGSDAHYWPDIVSVTHRAFVKLSKDLKPKAVIMNGDALDGASISRHPPIGWEKRPSVVLELEACRDRLGEITVAAGKAKRFWPLGNHDSRFETRLATVAPEYARVKGVHLKDHIPDWEPCWSVAINGNVIVKHRFKGGIHATHNNTVWSGWSIFTGHLHSSKVTPFTDLNGTRYGVDCGTMADPFGPQFEYQEDNPRNHRQSFAVATFHRGRLLMPELVQAFDENHVEFRGEVVSV